MFAQLQKDYIEAMKNKQDARKMVLNTIIAAIKNKKIETQKDLEEDEILQIMKKEVKIIQETIGFLEQAQKMDDLALEKEKLATLQSYLPATLSPEATKELIQKIVAELGVTDIAKQRGQIMGALMKDYKSQIDPSLVNTIISSL